MFTTEKSSNKIAQLKKWIIHKHTQLQPILDFVERFIYMCLEIAGAILIIGVFIVILTLTNSWETFFILAFLIWFLFF